MLVGLKYVRRTAMQCSLGYAGTTGQGLYDSVIDRNMFASGQMATLGIVRICSMLVRDVWI